MSVPINWTEVTEAIRTHETFKDQVAVLNKGIADRKRVLEQAVDQYGEPDHNGHIVLPLPEQIGRVTNLVKQRKISQGFDEDAATEILQSKKVSESDTLWDQCTTLVPVLDEDLIWAALYDGLLTEEEIDRIFPKTVSWAFVPTRVKA